MLVHTVSLPVRVQFALRSIGATISKITSQPDGATEYLGRSHDHFSPRRPPTLLSAIPALL